MYDWTRDLTNRYLPLLGGIPLTQWGPPSLWKCTLYIQYSTEGDWKRQLHSNPRRDQWY